MQADALVGAFHYDIPAVSKIPHGPRPVDFDVVRRSPSCLLDLGRHILALFWADPKLFSRDNSRRVSDCLFPSLERGCRDPHSMLQFNEAMLHHDPANGMMDDFSLSVLRRGWRSHDRWLVPGKSSLLLDTAKKVYEAERIERSDKEVRDE